MKWVVGGLVLLFFAALLRRLLRLNGRPAQPHLGIPPLSPGREVIYLTLAREMESQAVILAISLNEAIGEWDSGHGENALRLVSLSVSEWRRLADTLAGLLGALSKHLSSCHGLSPVRGIVNYPFKSRTTSDFFHLHELLDQLVFRSSMRFQLQIRLLRRAAEILTEEFRRAYEYSERTGDSPPELWKRFDAFFHDFDLVIKASLLLFRAFLVAISEAALAPFEEDLKAACQRGVGSAPVPLDK